MENLRTPENNSAFEVEPKSSIVQTGIIYSSSSSHFSSVCKLSSKRSCYFVLIYVRPMVSVNLDLITVKVKFIKKKAPIKIREM